VTKSVSNIIFKKNYLVLYISVEISFNSWSLYGQKKGPKQESIFVQEKEERKGFVKCDVLKIVPPKQSPGSPVL
jgi:hypothetical protein